MTDADRIAGRFEKSDRFRVAPQMKHRTMTGVDESQFVPGTSVEGHVNPNADAERKRQENWLKLQERNLQIQPGYIPPAPQPINGLPMPGRVLPPSGPTMGPQSLNSIDPLSVFRTVRLSSAGLNDVVPSLPSVPAPRRTLWAMMFRQ